jgi:putative mycofactocin binding protein MftB
VSQSTVGVFDASTPWMLSDQVSLRDEAFGALAYHHGNRRLVFLKSPELVTLVRRLEEFASADEAIDAVVTPKEHLRYVKALSSLAVSGILSGR